MGRQWFVRLLLVNLCSRGAVVRKARHGFVVACLVAGVTLGLLSGCGGNSVSRTGATGASHPSDSKASGAFPNRPITILVPYAAGGTTDMMARALARAASEQVGQPVVVENRPGGSGSVAMAALKASRPDGYTVAMTTTGPMVVAPNLSEVGYTPEDFVPIMQVADIPNALAVRSDAPYQSLTEFFKSAEKNPNQLSIGTPGASLAQHITLQEFTKEHNYKINLVPFNGDAEAVKALLGGNVDAMYSSTPVLMPYVKDGRLRLLGVASTNRLDYAPDVPTFQEEGFDLVGSAFFGLVAPKGTPGDVVQILEGAFKAALDNAEKDLVKLHVPVSYLPGNEFGERLTREFEKYRAMLGK